RVALVEVVVAAGPVVEADDPVLCLADEGLPVELERVVLAALVGERRAPQRGAEVPHDVVAGDAVAWRIEVVQHVVAVEDVPVVDEAHEDDEPAPRRGAPERVVPPQPGAAVAPAGQVRAGPPGALGPRSG